MVRTYTAIALYAAILLACVNRLPLWVDEILQLLGTRDQTPAELLHWMRILPGNAPLGLLVQQGVIHVAGYSVLTARLPSLIFGLLSCICLITLVRQLRLPAGLLILVLFMAVPLHFRYALEARPYSQGLFFSLLATVLFVRLSRNPTIWNALAYGLCALAGLYTTPFIIFTEAGHIVWALTDSNRRTALLASAGLVFAAVLFAPWYLFANSGWSTSIVTGGYHFTLKPATFLQIVREIAGAGGYLCSLPFLAIGVAGVVCSRRTMRSEMRLLGLGVICTIAGALAADVASGYFFAVRQLICVVPALAIFAALGISEFYRRRQIFGIVAAALLLGLFTVNDARLLNGRTEDWDLAAKTLEATTSTGACLALIPKSSGIDFYAFFQPSLRGRLCTNRDIQPRIVTASSSYSTPSEVTTAESELRQLGFDSVLTRTAGGTRMIVWERH